jgi:ABC-2 type transport system ATP-binding protein
MQNAVEVESLSKVFQVREPASGAVGALRQLFSGRHRPVIAVDEVSFTIQPGERVAFVGPNGAGKSTTIKMLSGVLHPSAGSARVAGCDPWTERVALSYRIGTVFGQRSQLWYHLPAADSFELLKHVYDLREPECGRRLAALVEAFGIGSHLHKPVRQLSLGERMRCELVASLLHAPEVLFLDEPTIGLDVAAKAAIRALIRDESLQRGRTLLLTSHDTADMERVCERVIVIAHGRVLLDRPLGWLRQSYIRKKRVTLQLGTPELSLELPGVSELGRAPYRLELEVELDRMPIEHLIARVFERAQLRDLTIEDPPLDEIVHAIYQGVAEPGAPPAREAS